MANIGFYSRHLTDDDVDMIGATTRQLINKGAGQVILNILYLLRGGRVEMFENKRDLLFISSGV